MVQSIPAAFAMPGLREGCWVALGQSCRLLGSGPPGCFYGGPVGLASPRASGCVSRGRTWSPATSQSTEGEQYSSPPSADLGREKSCSPPYPVMGLRFFLSSCLQR